MPALSFRRCLTCTLPPLLFAAATLLAYWPILHAGYIWDDDRYVQTNPTLRSFDGLPRIWTELGATNQYYPLVFTTFWLEYHAWGLNPLGYHLDNILLHVCSAIVLWRLLIRLQVPGAWAAALLFAVHPVQVESVAWITERKNVLSALLYLLSLWAYLRTSWGRSILEGERADEAPNWPWYALSLVLFFAALLSKTVTSSLPAVILLLLWWKQGRIGLRQILPLTPMIVAGAVMASVTNWVERNMVGAVGPEFDWMTPLDRLCIAGRALWFYLSKLIWPAQLTFIYPRWQMSWATRPWLIAFPICALALLAAFWLLRRRLGRGPLTAALFFAGTLVPALGFANFYPMQYSFVADHFQYLATIGPITLFAAALWRYAPRPLAVSLLLLVAAAFTLAANRRTVAYYDAKTLWLDTLAKNPTSAVAHGNLGQILEDEKDLDGAEAEFRLAVELHPVENGNRINIGYCYALRGDWEQAAHWYTEALANLPDSPNPLVHRRRADPYYRLGTAYSALADQAAAAGHEQLAAHDREAAMGYMQMAVDILPNHDRALNSMGLMLARQGQLDEAAAMFRKALQANPHSVMALEMLGNVFMSQGAFQAAIGEYRLALDEEPGNSRLMNNIGSALAQMGKLDEAISVFQAVLKIDPNSENAQRNLRSALAQKQATGQ